MVHLIGQRGKSYYSDRCPLARKATEASKKAPWIEATQHWQERQWQPAGSKKSFKLENGWPPVMTSAGIG